ncbi:uncharacterized protein LOC127127418 [Lathyrus oleraceus]|uniref:uncharacterized protein LOC127127418 n=1 Tax=Pisum sativum TaxID=3888 RepID=UPI0021CF0715|nr:uncharacterized protein LOC127127418 [Pisum sativum]
MKGMNDVNVDAYKHMMSVPPIFWSRSYLKTHNKFDVVLNNMFEAFNSVILKSMAKPLITIMEDISNNMMENGPLVGRGFKTWQMLKCYQKIRRKIEKNSTYKNWWLVRRWELTGLPCVHALSSMNSRNYNVDDYIPE